MEWVRDFVALSSNDPWWVTATLLIARSIEVLVIAVWVGYMLRRLPPESRRSWPWTYSWPRVLAYWLVGLMIVITINVFRVLLVGHIRQQNEIGQWFRVAEVIAAVQFCTLSVIAFRRWATPDTARDGMP